MSVIFPPSGPPPAAAAEPRSRFEVWLDRIWLVWVVVLCVEIGVVLTVLPWTPYWSRNNLFALYPGLRALMLHGFVRGLVSGIGLLDLWIGISVAVHYREDSRP